MSHAQAPTQSIRGKVIDAESRSGLGGANIVVMNTDPLFGATTGNDGVFKIEKVGVRRHTLKVSYVGYKTAFLPELLVTSGKETVLTIELEEIVVSAGEVEIRADVAKDKTINPMAMVSSRSFNVEETRRYAGSLDDPMRAVSNFAGVVANPGVNSNQIMIRGNSPKGLLWRVEGMDIPGPVRECHLGGPPDLCEPAVLFPFLSPGDLQRYCCKRESLHHRIWAIQVRNLLNQTPDVGYLYNDFTRSIEPVKSLGIIPLLSYKVEF